MKRSDDDTPMQPFEDLSEPATFTLLSQEKSKSKGKDSVQKKKKQEPLARRSFHNAWMVDSQFCYTPEQEAAILAALPGYQDGQSVVRSILSLARDYLSEAEHRIDEPLPSEITAQIEKLEECVENLQACLWGRRGAPALHGPTIDAIDLPVVDYFLERTGKLPEETFHTLLPKLKKLLHVFQSHIWIAQGAHKTKRGNPGKNAPFRTFVAGLYELWRERSTASPTRRTNWDTHEAYGPFHDFLVAVVVPVRGIRGLDDVARDVIRLYSQGSRRKKAPPQQKNNAQT